jgi:outer membrane protein OmpA-like peptidoglycan-associated protein
MQRRCTRQVATVLSLFVLLGIATLAFADEHLRGVVAGRAADGSLIVRTDDVPDMIVVLTENTKVTEMSGMRVTDVDVAALVPGLRIDVGGSHQSPTRFVAERIVFTRNDLKVTRDIEGGIAPTNEALQSARVLIDSNQQQNNQRFAQNQQTLEQQERRIADNDQKIVATSGAVDAANTRISNLDDYSVMDTLTVYFRNGQATISRDYQTQLRQLADKAKGMNAYSVQIEGHASAVGNYARNQRLSRDRAENVTELLQQSGIPTTKMFVPAVMGVSEQVASNSTRQGQAQNRRVVVRILQNRGITGN